MPRFGLKDLFISVLIFAVGSALLALPFRVRAWADRTSFLAALLVVIPGPLFGAGIGKLFKQTWFGAQLGLVLWFLIGFAMALFLPARH